jgi:hypothetical protein
VAGGGEHRHAGAELGDDDLGAADADPGDLIEPLHQPQHDGVLAGAAGRVPAADQPAGGAGRRHAGDEGQLVLDPVVQAGDLVVDRVDEPQVQGDLEGVDLAEPSSSSSPALC